MQKKLGFLLSGGKDSLFAAFKMKQEGNVLACAIIMKSKNPSSYMFHTPNIDITRIQAECMGVPLVEGFTDGEKEKELDDLHETIKNAKNEHGIEGVVTGALFSSYQSERIEKVCKDLDLEVFSPLWHMDQEEELRSLLKNNFNFIFSSVASLGLDSKWLGRVIDEKDVDMLVELNKKYGINIAGEGGEFESLVLDCPLFNKAIEISDCEIITEDENTATFNVKQAKTYKKRWVN